MRFCILLLGSVMMATIGGAQAYNTAVGLRLTTLPGISWQQHIAGKYSLEATIQSGIFSRQTHITATLQKHYPIAGKNMNLYLGAGPQWTSYTLRPANKEYAAERYNTLGVAALAGLELRIQRTLLSFDYRPALRLGGPQLFDSEAALSIRYIMWKQQKKKKKQADKKPKEWWPFNKG